jgi:hypothetical protein
MTDGQPTDSTPTEPTTPDPESAVTEPVVPAPNPPAQEPPAAIPPGPPPTADGNPPSGIDSWAIGLGGAFIVALLFNFVELNTLNGLPAHPLLLHTAVIFIPTLAVAAIVFALKPSWRLQYGLAYAIGAIVTLAATILTVGAGEAYKNSIERGRGGGGEGRGGAESALDHHGELGDTLKIVVILFVVLILIQVAIDRGVFEKVSEHFRDSQAPLSIALAALTIILALVAIGYTYATGHAGAKLVFGKQENRGFQVRGGQGMGQGRQGFNGGPGSGQQMYPGGRSQGPGGYPNGAPPQMGPSGAGGAGGQMQGGPPQ